MKKITILLVALIATASISFAGTTGPSGDFSRGNWSTHSIQAVQQKLVVNDANGKIPGLWSTYSVDNKLIDTSSLDRNTNLEGLLSQVNHVTVSHGHVANM
jgi:hypothetical protein